MVEASSDSVGCRRAFLLEYRIRSHLVEETNGNVSSSGKLVLEAGGSLNGTGLESRLVLPACAQEFIGLASWQRKVRPRLEGQFKQSQS